MGPFWGLFFWFRFRSFLSFFRVFAVGCVISFSWCWRRAALFSVGLFVCVFVCVFSSFLSFLGSFLALGAGRRAAFFSVGLFVCVFVCVFSLFGLFRLFGSGCWAPCCSFFRRAFYVRFSVCVFSSFRAFLGSFLALGAGRRAALFSVVLFCVRFCFCFLFFSGFFGFLATTGGGG